MSCETKCIFESLVMDGLDNLIAIDTSYNINVVNNAMKRNAKQLIGTSITEGLNLKEELWHNPNLLSVWISVIEQGQPVKKKLCGDVHNIAYKLVCYPIVAYGEVKGAYGFFKAIASESQPSWQGDEMIHHRSIIETLDRMPHLIWIANVNGEACYGNQRWCDYTGLKLESTSGQGWTAALHPDDGKPTMDIWKESVKTGKCFEIMYRLKRFDGVYRWHIGRGAPVMNQQGTIIWWLGTCTDIEDYIQVSKLSAQLSLLMAAAHFGVWSWDLANNKFEFDENLKELFNIQPENTKWKLEDVMEYVNPEDADKVTTELKRAVDENAVYDAEFRIKETGRVVAGRGKMFSNTDGKSHMLGINWDITQRKRLEQEKVKALQCAEEEARKRIQEAQEHHKRLEEFVDTICHEIRNPLNGITGIISLMRSAIQSFHEGTLSQITDYLGTLELCAAQQQVIVDDVLDLSKVERATLELNPTVFNVKNLVEAAQGMFVGLVTKHNSKYSVTYNDSLDSVWCYKADSHRLSQILLNLLSNSIKFTENGTISISISKKHLPDSKCDLHFVVSDTGIGMTSDELTNLFNKFSQANPSVTSRFGGSGLGLVISKKLVEHMGGRFEVESHKGVGTKFHFSVLCEEVGEQQSAIEEKPGAPPEEVLEINLTSTRVLIVEDNVINQKILMSYMQQKNCICQLANNGVEAVASCEESKFDIIFMDLEMPIMGGLEATRKLRGKSTLNQNTLIIGLSGNARKEHMDEAIRSGMNAYLTKPYHKSDIYKTVMQLQASVMESNEKRQRIH